MADDTAGRAAARLRIAFVNGIFPQLSQTFVLNHIEAAARSGADVAVLCTRLERGVAHPAIDRLKLYDRLLYAKPRDRRMRRRVFRGMMRHPGRLARFIPARFRGEAGRIEFAWAAEIGAPPDVIVANFGPNGIAAARLKRTFFPKAKLVVLFHGYDLTSYVAANGYGPYQAVERDIDLALCVNDTMRKNLAENTKIARVETHHLGVPIESAPSWRGHDGGDFVIVFVGRMMEKKGFRYLLDAVVALAREGLPVRVEAVGDGPELDEHREAVKRLGLDRRVVLHGARDHSFVLGLMSRADALVAPSVTAANGDQEGIPVTLMEAMAVGLPVVSTWHSGIPELVRDEASGLLTPERDSRALAAALRRLIADPGLRMRLAEGGRRAIAEGFDARAQDEKLFGKIAELAKRR